MRQALAQVFRWRVAPAQDDAAGALGDPSEGIGLAAAGVDGTTAGVADGPPEEPPGDAAGVGAATGRA